MLPHSEVVAYIALLLLSTSPCAAWLCNVTLEGNASASPKLEISRAAVQCSPGLNEQRQQLAVSVATSAFLSEAEATFEGNAAVSSDYAASLFCLNIPSGYC